MLNNPILIFNFSDKIEKFIDDNKALMRRMYGDFEMTTSYGPPPQSTKKRKRHTDHFDFEIPGIPDLIGSPGDYPEPDQKGESYFKKWRTKRQSQNFRNSNTSRISNQSSSNTRRGNQNDRVPSNQNQSENTGRSVLNSFVLSN